MSARKRTEKSFGKYRKNLIKESKALKLRLRGTMNHISVMYFEEPAKNSDGSMKLDALGMQIKKMMKRVAPVYINRERQPIKLDRERRRIINHIKAKKRKLELSYA